MIVDYFYRTEEHPIKASEEKYERDSEGQQDRIAGELIEF